MPTHEVHDAMDRIVEINPVEIDGAGRFPGALIAEPCTPKPGREGCQSLRRRTTQHAFVTCSAKRSLRSHEGEPDSRVPARTNGEMDLPQHIPHVTRMSRRGVLAVPVELRWIASAPSSTSSRTLSEVFCPQGDGSRRSDLGILLQSWNEIP